ncbi:unnamed protein product, partial [Choristocarpus tenellus]
VLVRGSALPVLSKAIEWGQVTARLVPLECRSGQAACKGVLPEEFDMDMQVEWWVGHGQLPHQQTFLKVDAGRIDAETEGESFDFLSATFGGTLPQGHVMLAEANPADACQPLQNRGEVEAAAVLVRRGGCTFGEKAKNVQDSEGRVMIVADNSLGVLQNVGALDNLAKELFMPAVFVTSKAGDRLAIVAQPGSSGVVHLVPDNSIAQGWADLGSLSWPDKLLERKVLMRQLQVPWIVA